MSQKTTRLFGFRMRLSEEERKDSRRRDRSVGFCLVTAIPPCAEPENEPAFSQPGKPTEEIIAKFKTSRRLEEDACAIEINKIGLYDKYTGQGLGQFFLAKSY